MSMFDPRNVSTERPPRDPSEATIAAYEVLLGLHQPDDVLGCDFHLHD
jgi:hypothetical protein